MLTVKSGLPVGSKPIDSGVDHAKILLEQSHGWTNVDHRYVGPEAALSAPGDALGDPQALGDLSDQNIHRRLV